ncbi:protein of unknown function [Spirosomataceae bacterium TFI 002]|nr:protein of unknown function [Spirosomataceae bacterium TFI 002]
MGRFSLLSITLLLSSSLFFQCKSSEKVNDKPRVIISTDIGGTDPDDFQSMIHAFMYADLFQLEGLISSPFGNGRKRDIEFVIDLYEKDLQDLKKHAQDLPDPEALRAICKQGSKLEAPFKGFSTPTEGSEWIIKCAKKESEQPLFVLVWGGIEDVAQALHDAPEIEKNMRVYWIGGPNKKWSINAYSYIAENHPNVWMIEANATYRGWFMEDENAPKNMSGAAYYENFVQGRGAMGADFVNHYKGHIKMGDTPSLAYLMNGDPDDPTTESWGGKFIKIDHSSRTIIDDISAKIDTVVAYGVTEWKINGPELNIPEDSICFTLEVQKQVWPGYYLGNGIYGVRYSSKKPEKSSYRINSQIPELDGLEGQYVSITPWPGKQGKEDYKLGSKWYGDMPNPELFLKDQQGARTISKYRSEYLSDWAKRWAWIPKR